MKFDFKQIQGLVEKSSEIISKTQQIVSSVQKTFTTNEETNNIGIAKEKTATLGLPEKDEKESLVSTAIDLAVVGVGLKSSTEVVAVIDNMMRQANETIRFCEEQKTIRTEIKAQAEVEIGKINAMANLVRDYLVRSFDERAGIFDSYFSVLDHALEEGDNMLVAQTLQSINSLATSSPFKDLADINKVTEQLSAGTEWDI